MAAIISGQEYFTNSGLLLKYGSTIATPQTWGDYAHFGANRLIEGTLNMAGLSTSSTVPSIINDVVFMPALGAGQLFIEKVELVAEVGLATGTSFNIGLIQMDRSTIPTNYGTALVNAEVTATLATAGMAVTYFQNTTHAGGLIGSAPALATGPYYFTAYTTGAYTGTLRIRIYYHAIGVITQ